LPWFHLGERFLVCLHHMLGVWETRSGASAPVRERLRFPQWYSVAYDCAGTRLAALRGGRSEVAIHELPSGRKTGTIRFDLAGDVVAMSGDAEAIAVRQGTAIEVRSAQGTPIRRFAHPGAAAPDEHEPMLAGRSLRFSSDGQRLASFREGDGWRIWALAGDHAAHLPAFEAIDVAESFAAPSPRDWDVEGSIRTLFVHRPTGTRIALPAAGPWVPNPTDPRVLACDDLHVELRAG
jgi:hypothetical protein